MIDQLLRPKGAEPRFVLHPHIDQALADFKLLLSIGGTDLSLLDGLVETFLDANEAQAESFHRCEFVCVRTLVRAMSIEPQLDFWVFVTFGHTGDDRAVYTRPRLVLDFTAAGQSRQPFLPLDTTEGTVGHGQGLPIKHFRYDFSRRCFVNPPRSRVVVDAGMINRIPPYMTMVKPPRWLDTDEKLNTAAQMLANAESRQYLNFEQTYYSPSFPGRTGDQEVFGCYHILPDLWGGGERLGSWRDQLYAEGCRPGHFVHADGQIVEESRFPRLVLHDDGWFHPHSKGFEGAQGSDWWFKHGDGDKMARDPGLGGDRWYFFDRQHWGLGPICQAFILYADPGLRLLIDHLTESFLWATPVDDRGPSHHNPGAARAIGRMWESGANLYWALEGQKSTRQERIRERLEATIVMVLDEWDESIAKNGHPWKHRGDGVAVWEHAIWVKGIAALLHIPFPSHLILRLRDIGLELSRFVFDGFHWFPNENGWGLPYVLEHDLTNEQTRSSSLGNWCVPALQIMDRFGRGMVHDKQEHEKLGWLIHHYVTNVGPDRSGGWGEKSEWRLW